MEPLFEVQGVMTEEVLRKAYRVSAKRTRTRVTLEYAFFGGMFFITLALGFFLLYMGDWSGLLYSLCVAFLAVIPPLIQKLAEKTMVTSSQDILGLPVHPPVLPGRIHRLFSPRRMAYRLCRIIRRPGNRRSVVALSDQI